MDFADLVALAQASLASVRPPPPPARVGAPFPVVVHARNDGGQGRGLRVAVLGSAVESGRIVVGRVSERMARQELAAEPVTARTDVGNIQYASFGELSLRADDLCDVPESDLHSVLRKRESHADAFLEVTLVCRADSAGRHELSVALSPLDGGAESGCVVELEVRVG